MSSSSSHSSTSFTLFNKNHQQKSLCALHCRLERSQISYLLNFTHLHPTRRNLLSNRSAISSTRLFRHGQFSRPYRQPMCWERHVSFFFNQLTVCLRDPCTCARSARCSSQPHLILHLLQDRVDQLEAEVQSLKTQNPSTITFSTSNLGHQNLVRSYDVEPFNIETPETLPSNHTAIDQVFLGQLNLDEAYGESVDNQHMHTIHPVPGDGLDFSGPRQITENTPWDQMPVDFEQPDIQQTWSNWNFDLAPLGLPQETPNEAFDLFGLDVGMNILESNEPDMGVSMANTAPAHSVPTTAVSQPSVGATRRQPICAHCFKTFTRHSDLRRHARSHDPNAPRISCPFQGCGKDFPRNDKLAEHRRRLQH
jgi:hypothetical protein